MKLRRLISITLILFIIFSSVYSVHAVDALQVPELDLNLKINNLTRGCDVYALLPLNMFQHNMDKFIENNINNEYYPQKVKAQKIKDFSDKKDYFGYIDYLIEEASFTVPHNVIELRHYTFCFGENEIIGIEKYKDIDFVKVKLSLSDNNEFKLVLKDYLSDYAASNVYFMIDEYHVITYIDVSAFNYRTNAQYPQLKENNIVFDYESPEDSVQIEKSIQIAYWILYVLAAIFLLWLIIKIIKEKKKAKQEIIDRRNFFKSPERIERELEERKDKRKKKKEKKDKKEKKNKK